MLKHIGMKLTMKVAAAMSKGEYFNLKAPQDFLLWCFMHVYKISLITRVGTGRSHSH